MSTRVRYEGGVDGVNGYSIVLVANPIKDKRWRGGHGMDYEEEYKLWEGTGVLVYPDGRERSFAFRTDCWDERERNWDRSLSEAVFCFIGHDGKEVFPSIDSILVTGYLLKNLKLLLESTTKVLPDLHLKPMKAEELLELGAIGITNPAP